MISVALLMTKYANSRNNDAIARIRKVLLVPIKLTIKPPIISPEPLPNPQCTPCKRPCIVVALPSLDLCPTYDNMADQTAAEVIPDKISIGRTYHGLDENQ